MDAPLPDLQARTILWQGKASPSHTISKSAVDILSLQRLSWTSWLFGGSYFSISVLVTTFVTCKILSKVTILGCFVVPISLVLEINSPNLVTKNIKITDVLFYRGLFYFLERKLIARNMYFSPNH